MTLRLTEDEYRTLMLRQRKAAGVMPEEGTRQRCIVPVSRPPPLGRRWEDAFAAQLDAEGIAYEREFRFMPPRRFRFDFALHSFLIAVEIDGGVHCVKSQFTSDREKGQLALLAGWRVLHVSSVQVRLGEALELLRTLLQSSAPGQSHASA